MKMSTLDTVAMLLVVVGALNWGLVGLTGLMGGTPMNLVESLLGGMGTVANVVYVLVGVGGLLVLWSWFSKMK